jgi:hypothetical protein
MRQGQQNRRGRGRGRKPQNPLARSFESNGPDIKIRGTASHIAEKYMSLARDALASGDIITAESYLQHAEHYNRIIMAAQAHSSGPGAQQGDQANGGGGRGRQSDNGGDDENAEQDSASNSRGNQSRGERGQRRQNRNGGQGVQEANGAEPLEAKTEDGEAAQDAVN